MASDTGSSWLLIVQAATAALLTFALSLPANAQFWGNSWGWQQPRHECRHRRFPPRRRPDASRRNARPGLAATDDREASAERGERFCRRQPNAIGGTRDQDLLVVHGTAIQGLWPRDQGPSTRPSTGQWSVATKDRKVCANQEPAPARPRTSDRFSPKFWTTIIPRSIRVRTPSKGVTSRLSFLLRVNVDILLAGGTACSARRAVFRRDWPVAERFLGGGNGAMRHSTAGEGTGSTSRCYRERGTRVVRVHAQ